MLSNGVKVSRGIISDGHILRLGSSTEKTEIKVWDDECEKLYQGFLNKRSIRKFSEDIRKLVDNPKTDLEIINKLGKKINKIKKHMSL